MKIKNTEMLVKAKRIVTAGIVCTAMLMPTATSAKARTYSTFVAKLPRYKTEKKYNLDHKGKADKLKITYGYNSEDFTKQKIRITVNSKTLTINPGVAYFSGESKLMRMKNGKYYVYVKVSGDDDWGRSYLVDVSTGKMPALRADSGKIYNSNYTYEYNFYSPKVKGNTITVTNVTTDNTIGSHEEYVTYTSSSSGKLTRGATIKPKKGMYKYTYKASNTFSVYTSTSMKKKAYTVKKNSVVTVKSWKTVKGVPYFYVTSGKHGGYIKGIHKNKMKWTTNNNMYFKNVLYAG